MFGGVKKWVVKDRLVKYKTVFGFELLLFEEM